MVHSAATSKRMPRQKRKFRAYNFFHASTWSLVVKVGPYNDMAKRYNYVFLSKKLKLEEIKYTLDEFVAHVIFERNGKHYDRKLKFHVERQKNPMYEIEPEDIEVFWNSLIRGGFRPWKRKT